MRMFSIISPNSAECRMRQLMVQNGLIIGEEGIQILPSHETEGDEDAVMYTYYGDGYWHGPPRQSRVRQQEICLIVLNKPKKSLSRLISDWMAYRGFAHAEYAHILDLDRSDVQIRGYVTHKANNFTYMIVNKKIEQINVEDFIRKQKDPQIKNINDYMKKYPKQEIVTFKKCYANATYFETEARNLIDLVLTGKDDAVILDKANTTTANVNRIKELFALYFDDHRLYM